MSPEEAVSRVTELIEASPDVDEQKLHEMLRKRAVQPFLADQLVVLVPLAFSRTYFESLAFVEKQYWDHFLLIDRKSRKQEQHRLDWNPFFSVARGRARKLAVGSATDRERLKVIASRSAEYQAIDSALSQVAPGTRPEALGTSPVMVLTDLPEYGAKPAYQTSVRFREAFRGAEGQERDCALAINLVIDEQHPIEEEIRHINECFLDWLGRRKTNCKQMVIAFEAGEEHNQEILENCQILLQQDLGMETILEQLEVDVFLIDPATGTDKQFKLAWQPSA